MLMGSAKTGQLSTGRSASRNKSDAKRALSVLSPVHRRAITGSAPRTPSSVVMTEAPKRLKNMAEDDETESLEGSSSDRLLRQYDKWTVEEEHLFFCKLHAVSSLALAECFSCIAHHLPNKDREQVKDYYYRLKAQFQKHSPERDVDSLSQKELIQAMTSMWSAWSKVRGQKPKLSQRKRDLANSTKLARYVLTMQEVKKQVDELKAQQAQRKAQKRAERVAERLVQQKAAKKAERLRLKEAKQQAEHQAEQLRLKEVRAVRKGHISGPLKENNSLASNRQVKGQKGQALMQAASGHMVAQPARRKLISTQLEQDMMADADAAMPAPQQRRQKASRTKAVAAASDPEDSTAQDSTSQTSAEGAELSPDNEELQLTQAADSEADEQPDLVDTEAAIGSAEGAELSPGNEELQLSQAADSEADKQPDLVDTKAAIGVHEQPAQESEQQKQQYQLDGEEHFAPIALESQSAAASADAQSQQQQRQQQQPELPQQQLQPVESGSLLPGGVGQQRKEPLCLRVRPLDIATKRLMQSLGCTALLEMPNNKPKKAVEGLLRHLRKKWERVVAQLGGAYELHLVGLITGQEDMCLSWRSRGISTALTLGRIQQQLQQTGAFLELSYVWMATQSEALLCTSAQSKASISATAAAGYALTVQSHPLPIAGADQATRQDQQSSGMPLPRLPFGSPLAPESESQHPAASSSSSARVLSEAFSSLQPPASQAAAAISTGHRSGAGENQTAAPPLDMTSSVSDLVTPCKNQQGPVHEAGLAQHDEGETPGTSQLTHSVLLKDLAWEGTSLPDRTELDIEPRLSQSHPDCIDRHEQPAEIPSHPPPRADVEMAGSQPDVGPSSSAFQAQQPITQASTAGLHCPSNQSALLQQAQGGFLELPGQLPIQLTDSLFDEPAGFPSREASVWSIQPPGALSAEPSGCCDELPDVPLSPQITGFGHQPGHAADHHQLPQPLHESSPGTCVDLFGGQHYSEDACPGMFDMPKDMEFDLPPLDSPDQAAVNASTAQTEQPQCALHHPPYPVSTGQEEGRPTASATGTHLALLANREQTIAAKCLGTLQAGQSQEAGAFTGSSFAALLASEEALPGELPDYGCSQIPNEKAYTAQAEEPALGIPLVGTVVMGVPLKKAPKAKKARTSQAKRGKPKQPRKATAPKAAQTSLEGTQGQQDDLDAQQQPCNASHPQQQQTADTPQAQPKRKRKTAESSSPPKLPSVSPGALSLQEGVKRRRLAKQAEEAQAASTAAAHLSLSAGQVKALCNLASEQLSEAPAADARSNAAECSQPEGDHSGQACDMPASTSGADYASQREDSPEAVEEQTDAQQQTEQTLSFDVGAMELFQQDTCDAFGSFWRRTSGIGAHEFSDASEVEAAMAVPAPFFGAGDISLGSWTMTEQANRPNTARTAANSPGSRPAGNGPGLGTATKGSSSNTAMLHQAAGMPAGSAHMDLTTYFAMLPNEVVPFGDLILPLPVTAAAPTEQQALQTLQPNSDSQTDVDVLCSQDCFANSNAASPMGSESGSGLLRPPTEQEIEHMDELDLSINLGSLLDPGESWIVHDHAHFAALEGKANQTEHAAASTETACISKPFQELFPPVS